jgi:hypothetical protein
VTNRLQDYVIKEAVFALEDELAENDCDLSSGFDVILLRELKLGFTAIKSMSPNARVGASTIEDGKRRDPRQGRPAQHSGKSDAPLSRSTAGYSRVMIRLCDSGRSERSERTELREE